MMLKRARPWILELLVFFCKVSLESWSQQLKIASKQIQKILAAAFVNYTNAFVSWQMLLLSLCIDADTLWNHVTHLVCAWWVCNVIHTPALSVACRHTCTNLHMKCHYKYFITISHKRDSSPKNENSVINYLPSCRSKPVRPSFIFWTQIKIFLKKSKSSQTTEYHIRKQCMYVADTLFTFRSKRKQCKQSIRVYTLHTLYTYVILSKMEL